MNDFIKSIISVVIIVGVGGFMTVGILTVCFGSQILNSDHRIVPTIEVENSYSNGILMSTDTTFIYDKNKIYE